jgi:hypothetical protein
MNTNFQIIPVYKSGDQTNISNYRPISLLILFSKIFEKVIYNRLYQHFDSNTIFAPEQYGFRINSSTELATYNLLSNILSGLNNKSIVGSVFCDLMKAFNCVDYEILISKLEFYGLIGKANQLIKSYLSNTTKSNNEKNYYSDKLFSKWAVVKRGIPQGSILGPLFFLIYINDL